MYNINTFDSKKLPTGHRLPVKEARPPGTSKVSRNQRCTGVYGAGKRQQRSIPNAPPPARQKKDDPCLS